MNDCGNMTEQDFSGVNGIGYEPKSAPSESNKGSKAKSDDAKERFNNWIIGFVLSALPVLAFPVYKISSNMSCNFLNEVLGSPEIMFIAITLAITVLNDFIPKSSAKKKSGWTIWMIVWMVGGALLYSVLTVSKYNENQNTGSYNYIFAICVNVVFLLSVLVIGLVKYISDIRMVNKS